MSNLDEMAEDIFQRTMLPQRYQRWLKLKGELDDPSEVMAVFMWELDNLRICRASLREANEALAQCRKLIQHYEAILSLKFSSTNG